MSLYDDFDAFKQKSDQVAGWSSGIKLLQSQMQLKKANQTQPKRDIVRKAPIVAPVYDLKNKKEVDNTSLYSQTSQKDVKINTFVPFGEQQPRDMDWNFEGNEYSPMWPNDYDKVVKDLRELRDREREREEEERRKRRDDRSSRHRDRSENDDRRTNNARKGSDSDDEDAESDRPPRGGGVAIAPPPVLQDASSLDVTPKSSGGPSGASVAAKIMAKYGFKEGQGLGKKEQGMSMALQVEKTSKRGGRIIHEKEIMPPPSFDFLPKTQFTAGPFGSPPAMKDDSTSGLTSITELMKTPSKVVLLKNMVGPGEVDQELEPEVKDECNTKYGDVIKVLIHELPDGEQEEAVRIFVEFKRIESAVKAVVDLNGRFFGGRQVKAGFYNHEKFVSFQLLE